MSIHRYILHNEQVHDAAENLLSAGQVGLLAGWGVFSTIRVADGVLFAFERHWARMTHDALLLGLRMPEDPDAARKNLTELAHANSVPNCTLRVVIVRNTGGIWQGPSTGRESDLIGLTANSKDWGAAAKLGYQAHARYSANPFSGAKILSWAMNLTWLENAQRKGFDEVILLNEHGNIAECTSANIFAAYGSHVFTPPLSSGCLPGITREILLSGIRTSGFQVAEKDLKPDDLDRADEVFITSTTRDLLPVAEIEGKRMKDAGKARPVLMQEFRSYLDAYIAQHREVATPAAR